ncbi:TIGR02444 family protein [Pseudomonas putida]|uniref:TIGR02444 family protein n=1 Tax=Pseudomonas putida TaxID=303 RepID=A0A7W2L4J0_PSEPU|nr:MULTISPECIES: TIGR02444 family protein [Pseudomonas]MBA6118319.1 TIGR02444 family protein [Pseudomonas putida]MBI6944446.1 TIGR02444 family protein [Pseudomonas putida]MBI6958618.1 TIGR02444 family protein [Pseudomonas putida]MEC4876800.1 TIGR02444 family protein [Pseudomonas sp. NC26]PZQ36861.1 MAG: TIGR02444 family protein [Pseudomonas putida]
MCTDLWNHALALYARPGVEEACMSVQAMGGDVCLLLCATWLQRRNVTVDAERAKALRDLAAPWQRGVVTPLRELRQQWRASAQHDPQLAALREQVKGLELQAERTLLERLQACAQQWPEGSQEPTDDWLAWLAPDQAGGHDALERLRAAAAGLQEAEDGA